MTVRVIRTTTQPRTQTVLRAGDIVVPWTMPTEREQRRRHWETYRPQIREGSSA